MKSIYHFSILMTLSIFCLVFNSGCKKETAINTIIQQDTIVRHDTTSTVYGATEEFNSGNNSELISSLHVQQVHSWVASACVYALRIPDLKKGDIVFAVAECEITNDNDYETGLYTQLILATNSYDVPGDAGWSELSESNGTYVTQTQHHYTVTQFGTYECTSDLGTKWVNFAGYAVSDHAGTNDILKVEQDYGRLSIIVWRKN